MYMCGKHTSLSEDRIKVVSSSGGGKGSISLDASWAAGEKMFRTVQNDPDRPADPKERVRMISPLQSNPCAIDPPRQPPAVERKQNTV